MLVSTRDEKKEKLSYSQVLLQGLAPDSGLYVLDSYPQISLSELEKLKSMSYNELFFEIKRRFIDESITDEDLRRIIVKAYTKEKFPFWEESLVPVTSIGDGLYLQNLSLGPTAAFKDMAMQALAQEIEYILKKNNESLVILGATSGDTGSAAQAAFKGLSNVKLFMLSPKIGMSDFQKKQMEYFNGDNIYSLSVDGRFDDCQDLVKELKNTQEFSQLGAVNSINWGRLSSQVPYYFSAYLQVVENIGDLVDIVVPSGNFGNIYSAYVAKKMGLPIRKLIVATNENNVLSELINTGIYEYKESTITSSPSMDISKASNYERLVYDIFEGDALKVKEYMNSFRDSKKVDLKDYNLDKNVFKTLGFYAGESSHDKRIAMIKEVYDSFEIVIDPHTADGVVVSKQFKEESVPMIIMETALPVKFEDTIKEALSFIPQREERFKFINDNVGKSLDSIDNNSDQLKKYIREHTI